MKAEVEQLGELCCSWSMACTSSLSPVPKPAVLGGLPGLRALPHQCSIRNPPLLF